MKDDDDKKDKSAIVKIAFDGDEIEAIRDGDRVLIVVHGVCDVLGIAASPQRRKLQGSGWAYCTIMVLCDSLGRKHEQFCIDLDSLPMWLATINPGKVRRELRPKLILYQKECARVLRNAFFGPPMPKALAPDFDHIKSDIGYIAAKLSEHPAHCGRISDSTHATNKLKGAIQATAETLDVTFSTVHGEFRKEHKITGYRYLPLTLLDHAIEWLRARVAGTRIAKVARQLSLWPSVDGETPVLSNGFRSTKKLDS